jgi:mannosyltransferase PIG-V
VAGADRKSAQTVDRRRMTTNLSAGDAAAAANARSGPTGPRPWLRSIVAGLRDSIALDRSLVAVFLGSRLLVLLAAIAAETLIVRNPNLTSGDSSPILRSLTAWDGWFYLGIVRDGYHAGAVSGAYHDYAFLPLYPAVVRLLSAPWPAFAGLVAVVVSNVAFLVALGLLVRLGEGVVGRGRARLAAVYLAMFPFAAVFAMSYTESLFLALALGAFLAAERDRRMLTGVLLALACLCRLQGVVMVIPLAIILLRRDGWRPRPSQAWLALGPAAAAAFVVFVASLTGSSSGYLEAQVGWGRAGVGNAAANGGSIAQLFTPYQASLLIVLGAAIFLLVYVRRDRLPLAYALVPILTLGLAFSSGLLEALGRITMLAFPYAWLLAGRRSGWFRRSWPLVSAGLMTLLALLMFGGYYVP